MRDHDKFATLNLSGMNRIFDSHLGAWKRLLWIAILMAGLGATVYQIQDRITWYLNYPKSVAMDLTFETEALFPAVTLCPMSKGSALSMPLYSVKEFGDLSKTSLYQEIYANVLQPESQDTFIQEQYKMTKKNIEEDGKVKSTFNLSDFSWATSTGRHYFPFYILCSIAGRESCMYTTEGGSDLDMDYAETHTPVGFCTTWKARSKSTGELATFNMAGINAGMSFTLFIEQYDYISPSNYKLPAGVQVLIHHPDEYPALIDSHAIYLVPGMYHVIPVSRERVTDLPYPHGKCKSVDLIHVPDKYLNTYSQQTCILDCMTRFLLDQCGCLDAYMVKVSTKDSYCTLDEYMNCTRTKLGFEGQKKMTAEYCNICTTPCKKNTYETTVSSALMSDAMTDYVVDTMDGLGLMDFFAHRYYMTKNAAAWQEVYASLNNMEQFKSCAVTVGEFVKQGFDMGFVHWIYYHSGPGNNLLYQLEGFSSALAMILPEHGLLQELHEVLRDITDNVREVVYSFEFNFLFAFDKGTGITEHKYGDVLLAHNIQFTIIDKQADLKTFADAVSQIVMTLTKIKSINHFLSNNENFKLVLNNFTEDVANSYTKILLDMDRLIDHLETFKILGNDVASCARDLGELILNGKLGGASDDKSGYRSGDGSYDGIGDGSGEGSGDGSSDKNGRVGGRHGGKEAATVTFDKNSVMRKNLLFMYIYLKDMSVLKIKSSEAYSWYALMCDIGGGIGLFLGGSILTVVEIVDVAMNKYYMYHKKRAEDKRCAVKPRVVSEVVTILPYKVVD